MTVAEMGDLYVNFFRPPLFWKHFSILKEVYRGKNKEEKGWGFVAYTPLASAPPNHAMIWLQKLILLSAPRTAVPSYGLTISMDALVIRL